MSQPTSSDTHIDAALSDLSTAYMQNTGNFIANVIFPTVPVMKQTDKYHTFDKNDWFRDDAVKKRAPEQESAGSGYGLSSDSYSCDVWATHIDISDQVRANADPSVPVERAATELVTQRMLLRREVQFNSEYMTTGVWGTDSTPGDLWSDYAASDPASDVDTARETILQNTGSEANTLVVGYQVHNVLKKHPLILERYKYTSSESITAEILANFFEVNRYVVSKGVYSTSAEDASSETYAFTTGKHALLTHVAPNPGIMVPSAGYNFSWAGLTGINDLGVAISNIDLRGTGRKIDRIEGEFAYDMKVVGSDLGYFFNSAIA